MPRPHLLLIEKGSHILPDLEWQYELTVRTPTRPDRRLRARRDATGCTPERPRPVAV